MAVASLFGCFDPEPVAVTGYDGGGAVVWLRGDHDIFNAGELSETLDQAMVLDGGDLIIDLSGVAFMGVATVGVILRARESLRLRNRSLTLRAPSVPARRVLDLCGVSSSFTFVFDPP